MASSDKKAKGSDSAKAPVAGKSADSGKAASKGAPAEAKGDAKAKGKAPEPPPPAAAPKRKLGIKGAAPWAARHAAKHAAEARARAAEPAPPGSARATIRTPTGADSIKEKLNELLKATSQLKLLRKNLSKNFYEMGQILRDVQAKKLYEPRNYPSFEAFLERETDLGKELGLKITRISSVFTRDAAMEMGLDKLVAALGALDMPKDYLSEGKMQAAPVRPPSGVHRAVEPSGRAF
jgi:hypothetical protein